MSEALKPLTKAVEAGEWLAVEIHAKALARAARDIGDRWPAHEAMKAFNGSLDAAKDLHDVLLPGFWYLLKPGHAMVGDDFSANNDAEGFAPTTARAWLLAILRAKLGEDAELNAIADERADSREIPADLKDL